MSDSMTALITSERSQIRAIGKKYKIGGLIVMMVAILMFGMALLTTPSPSIAAILIVYGLIVTGFAIVMIRIGLAIGESALHMRHNRRWSTSAWPFVITLISPEIDLDNHTGQHVLLLPASITIRLGKMPPRCK